MKTPRPVASVAATPGDCPAAAIAANLAAAAEALARLDRESAAREGDALARSDAERLERELSDVEDALAERACWVTPTSPRGALAQTVLLGHAYREAAELAADGDQIAAERMSRAGCRLLERLEEFLESAAGVTIEELGLSGFHLNRRAELDLRRLAA